MELDDATVVPYREIIESNWGVSSTLVSLTCNAVELARPIPRVQTALHEMRKT
jgi:hypothetical protein